MIGFFLNERYTSTKTFQSDLIISVLQKEFLVASEIYEIECKLFNHWLFAVICSIGNRTLVKFSN